MRKVERSESENDDRNRSLTDLRKEPGAKEDRQPL